MSFENPLFDIFGATGAIGASLTQNELTLKTFAALHPLGRIGEPEEVAGFWSRKTVGWRARCSPWMAG
jgi:hypothetical protein